MMSPIKTFGSLAKINNYIMDNNSESENLNGMEVKISPNTEVSFVRSLKGVYKV